MSGYIQDICALVCLLLCCQVDCLSYPQGDLQSAYDYVIVGGGTEGCVLAARLSENSAVTVLLLEAGVDDTSVKSIKVPSAMTSLNSPGSSVIKSLKTEPQEKACLSMVNQQCRLIQGEVLGGSSSVNNMAYNRGYLADFDHWTESGVTGWTANDVLPYFIQSENNLNENYSSSGYHGNSGPWTIEDNIVTPVLVNTFIQAGEEIGYRQADINSNSSEGFMASQQTSYRGVRMNTAEAFLRPVIGRTNLRVQTMALVTKIVITNMTATGVEVLLKASQTKLTINANVEVIISAGALLTPKLLMLSGIGPRDHLEGLGIEVLQDLPVGDTLYDHVMTDMSFTFNSSVSLTYTDYNTFYQLFLYTFYGQGPWSTTGYQGTAFVTPPTVQQDRMILLWCDFDVDLCQFQQSSMDNFDWIRHSGNTPSDDTGPLVDHTSDNGTGYYIYMEASSRDPNMTTIITTDMFRSQYNSEVCVEFYYHSYGVHPSTLTVYEVDGYGQMKEIWMMGETKLIYNNGFYGINEWIRSRVSASIGTRYIQFTATRGGKTRGEPFGDVAIDDFRIIDGPCMSETQMDPRSPEPMILLNCDFDLGISSCGFTQENTSDEFDWTLKSGSTPSSGTGPQYDNTQGTDIGLYIYIEASGEDGGTKAVIYTHTLPYYNVSKCLHFYYHMYGKHIGGLFVDGLTVDNNIINIWNKTNNTLPLSYNMVYGADRWYNVKLDISGDVTVIRFTAFRGGVSRTEPYGDIAIDDIRVTTGVCPSMDIGHQVLHPMSVISCTFEESLCGFSHGDTNYTWILKSGSTLGDSMGPQKDHTFNNITGHYMYIDPTGIPEGYIVSLYSQPLDVSSKQHCLSFYYYMYGNDTVGLFVYEVYSDEETVEIWKMTEDIQKMKGYNQGVNRWLQAEVTVSSNVTKLIFKATTGEGRHIALDDIVLLEDACPRVLAKDVPNGLNNDVLASCNFEQGVCGFNQTERDNINWILKQGPDPLTDYTLSTGTGFYMYLMGHSDHILDTAVLDTTNFQTPTGERICLTFYYNVQIDFEGSLRIYEVNKYNQLILLWSLNKGYNVRNKWMLAEVTGSTIATTFKFVGMAVRRITNESNGLAIDDINIMDKECGKQGYQTMSPTGNRRSAVLSLDLVSSLFGNGPNATTGEMFGYKPEVWEALHSHELGQYGMVLLIGLPYPRSTGTVRLQSNNITDDPLVSANYLTNQDDVLNLIKGIRVAQDLVKTLAFQSIGANYTTPHHPGCYNETFDTDSYWECYIRHNTHSKYDYMSSCRMGRPGESVVDSRLRVYGVHNLRIVDASVIPTQISGSIMATTVMIAEKAADMIKQEYVYANVDERSKMSLHTSDDNNKANDVIDKKFLDANSKLSGQSIHHINKLKDMMKKEQQLSNLRHFISKQLQTNVIKPLIHPIH